MEVLLTGIVAFVAVIVLVAALVVSRVKVAGPNQAFIITGRKGKGAVHNPETGAVSTDLSGQKVVMGASVFVLPVVQKLHTLDLSSRRISVGIRGAVSAQGIKCDLEGVAIVKVGGNEDAIRSASQRFLDQQEGITQFTQEVLAGALRAIVGRLTVDEIIKDRAAFASATAEANAARSLMISSTVRRPTMARREPARTSCVNCVMPSCWSRNRCEAERMASSLPPTLTIATPSRSHLMPWADTAPRMPTEMRREDRSRVCSFCTTGSTNTLAPITTFCPDRSVDTSPVSGLCTAPLPLRPVMMKAWLGPATFTRETTSAATSTITATNATMPVSRTSMEGFQSSGRKLQGSRWPQSRASVTITDVDEVAATMTTSLPAAIGWSAVADSFIRWPPTVTATSPIPSGGMRVMTRPRRPAR